MWLVVVCQCGFYFHLKSLFYFQVIHQPLIHDYMCFNFFISPFQGIFIITNIFVDSIIPPPTSFNPRHHTKSRTYNLETSHQKPTVWCLILLWIWRKNGYLDKSLSYLFGPQVHVMMKDRPFIFQKKSCWYKKEKNVLGTLVFILEVIEKFPYYTTKNIS